MSGHECRPIGPTRGCDPLQDNRERQGACCVRSPLPLAAVVCVCVRVACADLWRGTTLDSTVVHSTRRTWTRGRVSGLARTVSHLEVAFMIQISLRTVGYARADKGFPVRSCEQSNSRLPSYSAEYNSANEAPTTTATQSALDAARMLSATMILRSR